MADAGTGDSVITIVLADDHHVVRKGLRLVLESEAGFAVVDEAGDADTAVRKVLAYRPSVLLLDLSMPGGASLKAIPRVLESASGTAVVVLTMEADPAFAREALRAGALGYVLKEAADTELVQAIRMAAAGRTYLSPGLGGLLAAAPPVPPDHLSLREVDVLRLIARGHTNSEIAARLYLSIRTVESHRARIQHKTGCSSRAELVAYATEHKLA